MHVYLQGYGEREMWGREEEGKSRSTRLVYRHTRNQKKGELTVKESTPEVRKCCTRGSALSSPGILAYAAATALVSLHAASHHTAATLYRWS